MRRRPNNGAYASMAQDRTARASAVAGSTIPIPSLLSHPYPIPTPPPSHPVPLPTIYLLPLPPSFLTTCYSLPPLLLTTYCLHSPTLLSLSLSSLCCASCVLHPCPIPIPSLSHPYPIHVSSLSHPCPIPIPSLSHPSPIPIPSLSHPYPIPIPLTEAVPARTGASARRVPGETAGRTGIPIPSLSHPYPIPIPSLPACLPASAPPVLPACRPLDPTSAHSTRASAEAKRR